MGGVGSKTPRASTKLGRTAGAMFDDVELHVIKLTYKDLAELSRGDKRGHAIDKATFLQNFPVPGLVGDRLFAALDKTGSGKISFDDFIVGLAVCCRGSLEEKMRFIFNVYDMDGDGLISRDELLLMLNQVPRTLLNIGGGVDTGDSTPRIGDVPTTPFRRGRSGKNISRAGNELVPRPTPTSRNLKRSMSLDRREKPLNSTRRGADESPVVNPAFTNEHIAEQALKDFGAENGEAFTFDQFQNWAQQTPAIQALLQGAFPTDAHFSLATSPRARRASCESLVDEVPARRPSSNSDAAVTAVATVVGWTASRPSTRPSTPRRSQRHLEPVISVGGDCGPPTAGTSSSWGFFDDSAPVPPGPPGGIAAGARTPGGAAANARTPGRVHSRNTSYDNLLRSPIVGQGLISANSPKRGGCGGLRRGHSFSDYHNVGGGATLPTVGSAELVGRPLSSKLRGGVRGSERASPQEVWRWGDSGEPVSRKGSGGDDSAFNDDSGVSSPEARPGLAKAAPLPSAKKNDDMPLLLSSSRIRQRDPLHSAVASSGGGGIVKPVAVLRRSTSEIAPGAVRSTLPPMRNGRHSPIGRELSGKARKLENMARAKGTSHLSCEDLVALSLAERDAGAPAHDGGVIKMGGVGADGDEKKRRFKPILRHSRSFSHVDSAKLTNLMRSATPTSAGRLNSHKNAAKVGGKPDRDSSGTPPNAWGSGPVKAAEMGHVKGKWSISTSPVKARRSANPTIDASRLQDDDNDPTSQERTREEDNPAVELDMADVMRSAGGEILADGDISTATAMHNRNGGGTPASRNSGKRGSRNMEVVRKGGVGGGYDRTVGDRSSREITQVEAGSGLGVPEAEMNIPSDLLVGYPGHPAMAPTVGAEAVVRDCLYNSHGIVALDGYMWKPGSVRVVKRWFMLVDNTLYYFLRPSDKKPRGVISLPGCVAEAVEEEEHDTNSEVSGSSSSAHRREPRKWRVPKGFYGLRLLRPSIHSKEEAIRLFLTKSVEERDEWVAELRVASRVVPLEENFELKALLRKGAFASVHRGVHKETRQEYAIKVIDKTSLSGHEKSLLRGEIGALKLVAHPNVVRLEAVHEDPRSIAIVMTLCRGGDLWDKVRAQPSRCFTINQARMVMRPLCEAVLYLHDLGILHRDIKPENILLVDNSPGDECLSGVILSDFGFSHQVSPQSRLACGKQLMGTPSYMAPESILHGMYGKEVDWFACGCVLYMMLMGRAPFGGADPAEIFRNTCHGRLGLGRGGANHWDKLPAECRDLIVGLMQLDHNLRFTGEQAIRHPWLARAREQQVVEEEVIVVSKGMGGGGHRRHRNGSRGSGGGEKMMGGDGQYTPSSAAGGSSYASTSCASSSSSSGGGVGPREGCSEGEAPPPYRSIAEDREIYN